MSARKGIFPTFNAILILFLTIYNETITDVKWNVHHAIRNGESGWNL